MSTSNFKAMDYDLPLVVCDYEPDEWDNDYYYDFECEVEDFSDTLEFYEVTIEAGYYRGFQFWVSERNWRDYCDEEEEKKEEARAAEELEKIRDYLLDMAQEEGFMELEISGRFSNGEALYSRIA